MNKQTNPLFKQQNLNRIFKNIFAIFMLLQKLFINDLIKKPVLL